MYYMSIFSRNVFVLRLLSDRMISEVHASVRVVNLAVNLQEPCVLYTGQAFHYSPENAFYIFNQQIYFII